MSQASRAYKSAARGAVIDIGIISALVAVSGTILTFMMGLWAAIFLVPLGVGALYAVIMRLFHRIEDLVDEKVDTSSVE